MTTAAEQIALAERIEAQHVYGPDSICCKCSARDDAMPWPCDAILAARLLRESAQREAETQRAISVIVTNATGWRGLDGDAVALARRLASEFAQRDEDAFKRGLEAAAKVCDERIDWRWEGWQPVEGAQTDMAYGAGVCAAAIRALSLPTPAATETPG